MENLERLALAVVRQAVRDARSGDRLAAYWLCSDGPEWLDQLGLNVNPDALLAAVESWETAPRRAGKVIRMAEKNSVSWGANTGPSLPEHTAKRKAPRKPKRAKINNDPARPAAHAPKGTGPADKAATPTSKANGG